MQEKELYLPNHVFFCFSDDYCVFLDLKKDRYVCTDRRKLMALASTLHGWPMPFLQEAYDRCAALEANELSKQLVATELLTESAAHARQVRPTQTAPALSSLFRMRHDAPWYVHARRFVRFYSAANRASASLNRQSIEHTVNAVGRRKTASDISQGNIDLDLLSSLIESFDVLRSWFPRNYLCLFDSLALLEMLADYCIFPTWVFGVQPDPFEAHCWLQHHDVILNDSVDRVRRFVPIMAV